MTARQAKLSIVFAALLGVLLPCGGAAQAEEPSFDSYIEVLRADVRAGKVAIITEAMHLNDRDAKAFWPVYRKYDFELSKLNDQRLEVIKEYDDKFVTMNDAEAKSMAKRMLDCDSRIAALKRKYFKQFNKVLPALTVVKFFQLEHRLDLMVDMQEVEALPSLLVRPNSDDEEK